MFDEVRICGLGSIDEAVLELHPGLTVLSGETGAGKSSVVRAFGLLAGGRADAEHRSEAVERAARSRPGSPSTRLVRSPPEFASSGGELEGSTLLVARTVSADGRSRAFVGGRAVPAACWPSSSAGCLRCTVRAASSSCAIQVPSAPRSTDTPGRPVLEPLAAFHAARERWTGARRELAQLDALEGERLREVELLRLGLAEVERVAPLPGEDLASAAGARQVGGC